MSVILSALGALAAIAVSHGLSHAASLISDLQADAKDVSPNSIMKSVQSILKDAKVKSSDTYNKVVNQLNASPVIMGSSGAVKDFLTNSKIELQDKVNTAYHNMADVEQRASNIENQASTFASQPASYRQRASSIKDNLINQAKDLAQEVEQKVDNKMN